MNQSASASTSKVSYSQMAQQITFPTKEQAIILDAIDGISIQDYVTSLAKVIDPINIKFISRISNSRVCIYVNSKETADKLTNNRTKVNIGAHSLEIRPLISSAKRIILSNVCPIIPHTVITDELKKHGVKLTSNMNFIKAGVNGLNHVMSFRRQVYIEPNDVPKLPPLIKINFEGTDYWIYLSTDKLTCFRCKEEGHVAKFCKNEEHATNQNDTRSTANSLEFPTLTTQNLIDTPPHSKVDSASYMPPPKGSKRPLSLTCSDVSSVNETNQDSSQKISTKNAGDKVKKTLKRSKTTVKPSTTLEEITSQITPSKELFIRNQKDYPLNFENAANFIFATFGKHNVTEVAKDYTNNLSDLIKMISDIKENITEKKLQHRLIRIRKKLLENNDGSPSESCSETDF